MDEEGEEIEEIEDVEEEELSVEEEQEEEVRLQLEEEVEVKVEEEEVVVEEEEEDEEETIFDQPETPHTAVEEIYDDYNIAEARDRLKYETSLLEIPGVHKVIMTEETQKTIGFIAGDEKPWFLVDKNLLYVDEGPQELLSIIEEISQLPTDEVFVGCLLDESIDTNEFYICTNQDVVEQVREILELFHEDHKVPRHYIYREGETWENLGSDMEIDENKSKNSRPLIQVEIESKYPIVPSTIHLKARYALDCRDGYMELTTTEDEIMDHACKKRIDNYVQVTPDTRENEAQTICKYPTNISTQYEYDISDKLAITQEKLKSLKSILGDNVGKFSDFIQVNNRINLYSDDYQNLVQNQKYCVKLFKLKPEEYISFIEKSICQDKMISCAAFHPMWTGIVALSYVDKTMSIYLKDNPNVDEADRIIYDRNIVLLWCFRDDLMPKLILESPRRVYSLSFCPWNPYLLIGGLENGQIIVWDIANRLERVEDKEILTIDQQKYRIHIESLMKWMKNTLSIDTLRPTLISNLEYSHIECVHKIQWISPKDSVAKTGKIEKLSEGESLQFMTAAEDGNLLIWDLLVKIKASAMESKSIKKTKRLKQRPDDLKAETSAFEHLHLLLKPIYKIKLFDPVTKLPLKITMICTSFFRATYRRDENIKIESPSHRICYELQSITEGHLKENEIYVGSLSGYFIHAQWDGQEFDSGEVVNYEESSCLGYGKYHDGPIVRIDYSPVLDAILIIGGRIMSIWSSKITDRPILWRKCTSIYTDGSWYFADYSRIRLVRMDGHFEIWLFYQRSKYPIHEVLLSNGPIIYAETQEREHLSCVFGIAERRGTFRVYCSNYVSKDTAKHIQVQLKQYFEREITRKLDFLKWQNEFNENYAIFIETEILETQRESIILSQAEEESIIEKPQQPSQPEYERMKRMISERKQLNRDKLLKDREFLLKIEADIEIRRKKQREILRKADQIFRDTVATLFPDVIKEKPPPIENPYETEYDLIDLENCFDRFKELSVRALDWLEENPFRYHFDWVRILKNAKQKRMTFDGYFDHSHFERFDKIQEYDRQMGRSGAAPVSFSEHPIDFGEGIGEGINE